MSNSNEQLVPVEQPKPCPFCGNLPKVDEYPNLNGPGVLYTASHGDRNCPANGYFSLTKWNTRTPPAVEPDEGLVGPSDGEDVMIGEFVARWDDAAEGVTMDADTAQALAREFKRMSSGLEALAPTLLSAFRTTNSSPDDGYRMEFKFGSLADMHKADDEWHRLRHRLAHPLTPLIRAQALEEAAKVADDENTHIYNTTSNGHGSNTAKRIRNAIRSLAREKGAL